MADQMAAAQDWASKVQPGMLSLLARLDGPSFKSAAWQQLLIVNCMLLVPSKLHPHWGDLHQQSWGHWAAC